MRGQMSGPPSSSMRLNKSSEQVEGQALPFALPIWSSKRQGLTLDSRYLFSRAEWLALLGMVAGSSLACAPQKSYLADRRKVELDNRALCSESADSLPAG